MKKFLYLCSTKYNDKPMITITLLKPYRQTETLRLYEISKIVDIIRQGDYNPVVSELRNLYPMLRLERQPDGTVSGSTYISRYLPRICFGQELEKRNQQLVVKGYTGLVLLEVNNLPNLAEAQGIRRGAAELPQTLLAFVGASGRSVKIVCRGELLGGKDNDKLPTSPRDIALFHENLYERARLAYNSQLGVTIEKLEPRLDRTCYVSYDEQAYYNEQAIPIYARAEHPTKSLVRTGSTTEPREVSPNKSRYVSMHTIFEFNLTKAYDECEGLPEGPDRDHLLLSRLAIHCLETGIPMSVAKHIIIFRAPQLTTDQLLIEKVFENVYRPELVKRYEARQSYHPEKNIPAEALLTMKIDLFLNENYEIRKNAMRGVAEFRERTGIGFQFRDLTEEARNSMTMRALVQGIKCWDKDIRRYVNSEDIEQYDPLNEWLDMLPQWDGHDRVSELARRVPTDYDEWPTMFHLWMLSMVAMWQGKGQLSGNALVPLLIGRQGCGKSSFCRILLPHNLSDYYNDRINFKNEQDLNLGLTSFALINLDEFDKITERQQIVLKYLVSAADVKFRPPYGKAYTEHRRYASFIGTTNETMPLTDPSGARRFVCVEVTGDIDFRTVPDYVQLYAQLREELQNGKHYWPTREQEQELIRRNLNFQRISGLDEMLLSLVDRPADDDPAGRWMTLKELSALLKQHFRGYKEEAASFRKIGHILSRPEFRFKGKHQSNGNVYWVKLREE